MSAPARCHRGVRGYHAHPIAQQWQTFRALDTAGGVLPGVTRLDPNAIEEVGSEFAQALNGGMTGSVSNAGVDTSDPADALTYIRPLYDAAGQRVLAGDRWMFMADILWTVQPDTETDDLLIGLGISAHASMADAGLDALFWAMDFTGGNRVVNAAAVDAGSASASPETSPDSASERVYGEHYPWQNATTISAATGGNTDGSFTVNQARANSAATIDMHYKSEATDPLFVFLTIGRSSTDATVLASGTWFPRFFVSRGAEGGLKTS